MKKITLKNLDASGVEKLSAATMKKVTGGQRGCEPYEFECSDGSCIPQELVRDGKADCPDGSDEF
ncbi:LDL receptor domain-containing protein [Chitinophaga solisilvae]|uniref:LDL receptor domain-containing protein n=1 Tax=Chitinophaga solisilvae TaxID=1233460 RepID=UPI00136EF8C4|nr:LDL receptor domain-containing protein [Chitinophaga solisilvae]